MTVNTLKLVTFCGAGAFLAAAACGDGETPVEKSTNANAAGTALHGGVLHYVLRHLAAS